MRRSSLSAIRITGWLPRNKRKTEEDEKTLEIRSGDNHIKENFVQNSKKSSLFLSSSLVLSVDNTINLI